MSKAAELAALIGSQTALSNRNLIINGAMQVAQRGTSSTTVGYQTVDRFPNSFGTIAVTQSQDTDVPSGEGFTKSLKQLITTASSATDAFFSAYQVVEAQNLVNSGWDHTSPSSYITISFYAKASVTGTYTLQLRSDDGTARNYNTQYSLTADTWTRVIKTIPGNSGLTINSDNGIGLYIFFNVEVGTDYSDNSIGFDGWVTHNGSQQVADLTNNLMTNVNSTFHLTGVQIEVGEQATAFEHRSFGDELAKCQRYYIRKKADSAYTFFGAGFNATTSSSRIHINFPVEMRAAPTIGQSANSTFAIYSGVNSPGFSADATVNNPSTHGTALTTTHPSSTLTVGYGALLMANNDTSAFLEFIAEL